MPVTTTGARYRTPMSQPIEVIATPDAPPAIGPYSQAIRAGDFVFVSGQVPVDVRTGKLAEGIADRPGKSWRTSGRCSSRRAPRWIGW